MTSSPDQHGPVGEVYNIDTLNRGLVTIRTNIEAIEEALAAERLKEREYERQIAAAEAILNMHGVKQDGSPN